MAIGIVKFVFALVVKSRQVVAIATLLPSPLTSPPCKQVGLAKSVMFGEVRGDTPCHKTLNLATAIFFPLTFFSLLTLARFEHFACQSKICQGCRRGEEERRYTHSVNEYDSF